MEIKTFNDICETFGVDIDFCHTQFGIPVRTLNSWKRGERVPPEYVLNLLTIAIVDLFNKN